MKLNPTYSNYIFKLTSILTYLNTVCQYTVYKGQVYLVSIFLTLFLHLLMFYNSPVGWVERSETQQIAENVGFRCALPVGVKLRIFQSCWVLSIPLVGWVEARNPT